MIAAWMKICLATHPNCSAGHLDPQLPTRVIDVGTSNSNRDPFLYIAQGHRAQYLTLSYTWGHALPFTTKSSSLQARKAGMPLAKLPKTFQEAIQITRKLGVRYLWIDALCIIQDSEQDWKDEASRMAEVFRNALLTISAADAASPKEGIFRKRTRHRTRPYLPNPRLSYQHRRELGSGPLCVYKPENEEGRGARKPPSVLDTRGWVLQEELLTRRLLVFSKGELFWQCNCMSASESYPDGIPTKLDDDMIDRDMLVFKEYLNRETVVTDKTAIDRLHISWRAIIQLYSARLFTQAKDRLIALEGIGTALRRILGTGISSGLLNVRIEQDLLWRPRDSNTLPKSRLDWRAPSWSWASIDAPIVYHPLHNFCKNTKTESLATFVSAVGATSQAPMFSIRKIVIRGWLLKASLSRMQERWTLKLDYPGCETATTLDGSFYPDLKERYNGTVWVMPLAQTFDLVGGICLLPAPDLANEYVRIGTCTFDRFKIKTEEDSSNEQSIMGRTPMQTVVLQ
jgi:hypothetical protein